MFQEPAWVAVFFLTFLVCFQTAPFGDSCRGFQTDVWRKVSIWGVERLRKSWLAAQSFRPSKFAPLTTGLLPFMCVSRSLILAKKRSKALLSSWSERPFYKTNATFSEDEVAFLSVCQNRSQFRYLEMLAVGIQERALSLVFSMQGVRIWRF